MTKRKSARIEATNEQFYQGLHECMQYDAASLRALALYLNKYKKNTVLMKVASAELGRNARHIARAVEYFLGYFSSTSTLSADDYLKLFCYAQLKHALAVETFSKHKFDFPLWRIRELVDEAKPKKDKKPSKYDVLLGAAEFVLRYLDDELGGGATVFYNEYCNKHFGKKDWGQKDVNAAHEHAAMVIDAALAKREAKEEK